jgi:hypothetical protein
MLSNTIYGVTGTIGSESSKELLSKIYNVDFGFVP